MSARDRERERILALAHALRTPLTALQIGVGILDRGVLGTLTAAQREVVATLGDELTRLRHLVEGSLDTKRLGAYAGPSPRERVDFVDLVQRAVTPIAEQMTAKGVRLVMDDDGPRPVMVDGMRLAWAVAALAGNALRYAPIGSTIRVAVRGRKTRVAVEIHDEGPGIPATVRAQLRDRAPQIGTAALTLLMVRDVVEAHDGRLRVRAGLAVGAAVELSLPLAADSTKTQTSRSDAP